MKTAEYELRADERSRFEQELLMPFAAVLSTAVIVLYATANSVPGQFTGRGFHIPFWAAIAALCVLLVIWAMRLQRPKQYRITDDGVEIVSTVVTYAIPFTDIKEVVSIAERKPRPLFSAVFSGTALRAAKGFANLGKRLAGGRATVNLPEGTSNFTTSDTGGARIVCNDGRVALFSPLELSGFLRHLEAEFGARRLDARVVREVPVTITSSSSQS